MARGRHIRSTHRHIRSTHRHIRSTIGAAVLAVLATSLAACGSGSSASASARTAPSTKACVAHRPHEISDEFPTPDVRWSKHGVLETTLRASYSTVTLNGQQYQTLNYEGSVPGPTLVVCPGDTLIVHLKNDLGNTPAAWLTGIPTMPDMDPGHGQLTNLHTHGFHVSPRGHGDNVFTNVDPGGEFTYRYHVPLDHPPGMYWYHPHRHGYVDTQVYAGMFGVLYVQGGLDDIPRIADIPTRTIVVNALQLGSGAVVPDGDATNTQTLVNGAVMPNITVHPGELQRWRIINVGPDSMVRLGLSNQPFTILANDGNTLHRPSRRRALLVGPGEREEVLVRGGVAGDTQLQSLPFNQFQGGTPTVTPLATVHSTPGGTKRLRRVTDAALTGPQEDLRTAKVHDRHRIVYTEQPTASGGTNFLFNGKIFDPNRLDQVMHLGKVAEWTLVNQTTEWHTFHIHLNKFQVTKVKLGRGAPGVSPGRIDDVRRGAIERQDTVKLPPGSTVTLRTRPTDFTGKFVFHCHMLFHEDNGMMGTVEIHKQ